MDVISFYGGGGGGGGGGSHELHFLRMDISRGYNKDSKGEYPQMKLPYTLFVHGLITLYNSSPIHQK